MVSDTSNVTVQSMMFSEYKKKKTDISDHNKVSDIIHDMDPESKALIQREFAKTH